MKIQFNTDNNIQGGVRLTEPFESIIKNDLERFNSQITRVEVHLSDENGDKNTPNDKKCILEARLEGSKPIAVTHLADTHRQAVEGAVNKLKSLLESKLGRSQF